MVQTKEERFTKYVESVQTLNENTKKKPLPSGKALSDFYERFAFISGLLELKGISQAHVLGLSACMENLCGTESSLSLFSKSLEQIAEKLASGVLTITLKKNPTPAVQKLVQWWLILSLMTAVGLLEMGKAKETKHKVGDIPPDIAFQNQLMLLLFFGTNYPNIVFKEMAEAVKVPPERVGIFTALFELLALTFALISFSGEELKEEFVYDLLPRINKDLNLLLPEVEDNTKAFLEQIRKALEKGEIDNLQQIFRDLLESEGYSQEALQKDISAMKGLFLRLKQACLDAKAAPTNVIHMAG